jgi:transcriptional regulator with XRE-family HTH domain
MAEHKSLSSDDHEAHTPFSLASSSSSQDSCCEAEVQIGSRLRSLRTEQGYSIRALAEKCGLSANTLSLLEHNRTSPSVNTLSQLARGLEVPITTFFEEAKPKHGLVHQQKGQRPQIRFAHGTLEKLGEGLPPLGAEPILVTIETSPEEVREISHVGREFIYCLEGLVDCMIADQVYRLSPGDSLLFDAETPHRWVNAQTKPSKLLILFCPMEARDHPAERHLNYTSSTGESR